MAKNAEQVAAMEKTEKFEYAKGLFGRVYRECKYTDIPAIVKHCNGNGKSWGFNSQEHFTKIAKEKNQRLKFVAVQYLLNNYPLHKIEEALEQQVWTKEFRRTRNNAIPKGIKTEIVKVDSDIPPPEDNDTGDDNDAGEFNDTGDDNDTGEDNATESYTERVEFDENKVREIAAEEARRVYTQSNRPRAITVTVRAVDKDGNETSRDIGTQHKAFPELLSLCNMRKPNGQRLNVWLPGPAGSGKTTAAENVAKALNLPYAYTGALMDETKIFGYMDANGNFVSTEFFKRYTEGGVFLWDEADGSDPVISVMINAAIENGSCAFPHGMFTKHDDFIFIAAANTYGHGATAKYVGRNRLDAATLNRFVKLEWDYDPALEAMIIGCSNWYAKTVAYRNAVEKCGYDVVISTRNGIHAKMLADAGWDEQRILDICFRDGMDGDQWRQVSNHVARGY